MNWALTSLTIPVSGWRVKLPSMSSRISSPFLRRHSEEGSDDRGKHPGPEDTDRLISVLILWSLTLSTANSARSRGYFSMARAVIACGLRPRS
jgi:hypothetical protein